jgi:hypothetical protein
VKHRFRGEILRVLRSRRTAALMKFRSRSDDDFRDALQLASVGLCQSDGFVIPGPARGPRPRSRMSSRPRAARAAYERLLHRLKLLIVPLLLKVLKLAAARITRQLAQ